MGTPLLVCLSRNCRPKLQKLLLNFVVHCYTQKTVEKGTGFSAGSRIMDRAVSLVSGCRVFVTDDLSFSEGSFEFT